MKNHLCSKISILCNVVILTGWVALTGCTTTAPDTGPEEKGIQAPGAQNVAAVLKVNNELGYVILETTVAPQAGQEAVIKRGGQAVGTIKVTDDQSLPFVAADVISGNVHIGDAVLLMPTEGDKK